MPPNRENLTVAGQSRADRTFPGEVAIVEALTSGPVPVNQPPPIAGVAKVRLVEVSEAVK